MSPAAAPEKICIRCGTDVANAPRVRDQQGRYVCQPCYDAAIADRSSKANPATRAAAPARRPQPAASEAEELLVIPTEPEAAQTTPCPHCNQPTPTDAIVCFNCGYNKQTGQRQKTKVIKEKDKKAPPTKQGAVRGRGSDNRATLAQIASRQRAVLGVVLAYFLIVGINIANAAMNAGTPNPQLLLVTQLLALCVVVAGIVMSIMLAVALEKGTVKVVIYAFLLLVPLIGLLALLRLSGQATKRLKKAGYSVGLMGAQGI